ncbi:MAG: DUF4118 domain-containing protein [Bacteroidetes bacterium]|nr:DUF4118 domain-containing protein [Bacteroidota bacterium]
MAKNVELIDIAVDKLERRIRTIIIQPGKHSLYKRSHLIAFRQMALHYTASLLKKELIEYKERHLIEKSWKTVPRFLVSIGPSPKSEYLIRWTKRTAFDQKIPWIAVHVQTHRKLDEEEEKQLQSNFKLVKELGAELITTMDDNITRGIIRIARHQNVSHIVIGKPIPGYVSRLFFKKNLVDKLIKESGEIDVFVVSEEHKKRDKPPFFRKYLSNERSSIQYLLVLCALCILTIVNLFLSKYISYLSIGLIFLAAVSIVSSFFKKGPVFLFSSISAVLWNFLFIPPRFTFLIERLEDLFMFLMYFISAIITGNLTSQLKVKELFLRNKEKNLEELYQMSRILNETSTITEIIHKSMNFLKEIFAIKVAVFLYDKDLNLLTKPFSGSDFDVSKEEWESVLWCYNNKKEAGKFTDTFAAAQYSYIPFVSQTKILGVLGIDANTYFNNEQTNLLKALVGQIATAIERNELTKTYQKVKISEESEKLYQILLNSVSHELRTPITIISTAANGLIDKNISENANVRNILANDIVDGVERLNRLVDNLLGTLRVESKNLKLNLEWNDITEVFNIVRKRLAKLSKNHQLSIDIEKSIPMLKFDFILMEQLFFNLIHNAILYTPQGSIITVKIYDRNTFIELEVSDNGSGILESDKDKIFEKFYRPKGSKTGGLGLGLLICKEISEIHKGTISVSNCKTGGASFFVRLPLEKSTIKGELE